MARQFSLIPAFLIVFAVVLMAAQPAFAKGARPDGQKKLEAIFGELLDQYRKAAEARGAKLITEGDILVEPSGDSYYAVTLPHMSMKQPDGAYTEIGMIAVNALPGDKPEQWNMTIALPTPIIHYDNLGKPLVTSDIGGQNFAGVWDDKVKNFTKINARYSNLNIKHHGEQTRIVLPEMQFIYDLKETKPGLWSGPADLKISNLQTYFDADGSTANIKEIRIVSKMEDYSIAEALAYQESINALIESAEAGDSPSASGHNVMGLYNLVFDFMSNSWNAFDFGIDVKGVSMTRPPIPGSPPGVLKIADGRFGFGMAGLREGKVRLGFKLAYDGFELAPVPPDYGKAMPEHVNFDLAINNLPYREMVDLGRSTLQNTVDNPQMGQLAGLQAIAAMPQLLTQAQTNVTLSESAVGNEHYDVQTDALFTADMNAAMGATGTVNAEIFGIDNLIASLNAAAANPQIAEAQKQKIQDTLAALAIVKMAGQMGKDDQGRDIRSYKLELNQQGQTLLNGTDLQMLMQATQGGGSQAPAPAPAP